METPQSRLDLRGILSFTLIAGGLAWLVASPLWLSGQGLRHPLDYVGDLAGFAPHEVRAIMRDNPRKLVER